MPLSLSWLLEMCHNRFPCFVSYPVIIYAYLHVCIYIYYKNNFSICVYIYKVSEVAQSCPTLCNPMDCSLPGFSVHGIFQARVLEWVAISFSRRSSLPRDWTWISCIVARPFTISTTREVLCISMYMFMYVCVCLCIYTQKHLMNADVSCK